jgi:branched-chain amino acid transport system substrate-binding protein
MFHRGPRGRSDAHVSGRNVKERLSPRRESEMAGELLRSRVKRRRVLKWGAAVGAVQIASPFINAARGEQPVKIGMVDPLTGVYAAFATNEVEGAKLAVGRINKAGGVLGRELQLLVEDSANDTGTGVQKTRKLIDRDNVDVILGDVNSGIAYAMSQVTNEKKVLHIVPGGHTDPITGKDCKWNVFRVCNTTTMDAAAITAILLKNFGKKWFFLTPDYAYGHSLQDAFVKRLTAAGGTWQGDQLPIGTVDFSASLIKAKAYGPDVLVDIMGGLDQVNSLKQFVQFGLQGSMAVSGALYELESVLAVPDAARTGWWTMEWWWDQPGVPHVEEFVKDIRDTYNKVPSARHWFGFVAVNAIKLAAEKAKSLAGIEMAHALEGLELPPEVALQKGRVAFRAGDHELMPTIFVGEAHPPKNSPADVFTVREEVVGEQAAGTVAETGCHIAYPGA